VLKDYRNKLTIKRFQLGNKFERLKFAPQQTLSQYRKTPYSEDLVEVRQLSRKACSIAAATLGIKKRATFKVTRSIRIHKML